VVRGGIVRLVHQTRDVEGYARSVTRLLRRVVAFDGSCLLTVDPATMLPTGEVVDNGLPAAAMRRLSEIELAEPDFNKFTALAHGRDPAASLSGATRGDLDRSLRHRELRRPHGLGDELRVVLSDVTGTRGALTLIREAGRAPFRPADVRYLASIADLLADGVRRAAMLGPAATPERDGGVGLMVLDADDTISMANLAADDWLARLDSVNRPGSHLPLVVLSVANRARATVGVSGAGSDGAHARIRTPDGQWAVVRGSLLGDQPDSPVAIMMETARPPELAPLIADAYGLTARERAVTELVARGYSTNDIARRLHLSAYTVQDHLKAIFDKSDTRSRGDLVARIFFDHYAPRLAPDQPRP
jgi:DNA-binding NarL/FixJ family response regulator